MITKFRRMYCNYGLRKTFEKAFIKIATEIGIIPSTTFFYTLDLKSCVLDYNKKLPEKFTIKTISNFNELTYDQLTELKEINYDPIEEYLEKGSDIQIVTNYDEIVAYGCIQWKQYTLSWGSFKLNADEAWIGPAFVKLSYRNKGIHSTMRNYALLKLKRQKVNRIFTSVNSRNTASIRNISKLGFSKIGEVKIRRFLGKIISKKKIGVIDNLIVI